MSKGEGADKNRGMEEAYQLMVNEIERLSTIHQKVNLDFMTNRDLRSYYQSVDVMLSTCSVLVETIRLNQTVNERIGRYLLAAKKEAEHIVYEATIRSKEVTVKNTCDAESPKKCLKLRKIDERNPIIDSHSHSYSYSRMPQNRILELTQVESNRIKALEELKNGLKRI